MIRDSRAKRGSFTANWVGFTTAQNSVVTFVKEGEQVTLHFPQKGATSNATTLVSGATEVPPELRPASSQMGPYVVQDNGAFVLGTIDISAAGQISFGAAALVGLGGFTASGSKGFRGPQPFTYSLD